MVESTNIDNGFSHDKCIEKGNEFENYICSLFDKKYFGVKEWTSDHSRKRDIFVEADCNPDIVMRYRYKDRNELFAIECKFRKSLFKGKLEWSKYPQLNRYRNYQEENNIPVFVLIGLGGNPNSPERLFCIPLNEIEYPALYPAIFEKYERDPDKMFFWKDYMLQ